MIGHKVATAIAALAVAVALSSCSNTQSSTEPTPSASNSIIEDEVQLRLAPPAAEQPPELRIDGESVSWLALDWNSSSFSQVVEPNEAVVDRYTPAKNSVSLELTPHAEPIEFEVSLYAGTLESKESDLELRTRLDCLAVEDPCQWLSGQDSDGFTIIIPEGGPHVLAIQARYFAPPESNPDRVANHVSWAVALD